MSIKHELSRGGAIIKNGVLDITNCYYVNIANSDLPIIRNLSEIKGGIVYNKHGFKLPKVERIVYSRLEKIVIPDQLFKLDVYQRYEEEFTISKFINRITISNMPKLEILDVRCNELSMTLSGSKLVRNAIKIRRFQYLNDYYLLKMGVFLFF